MRKQGNKHPQITKTKRRPVSNAFYSPHAHSALCFFETCHNLREPHVGSRLQKMQKIPLYSKNFQPRTQNHPIRTSENLPHDRGFDATLLGCTPAATGSLTGHIVGAASSTSGVRGVDWVHSAEYIRDFYSHRRALSAVCTRHDGNSRRIRQMLNIRMRRTPTIDTPKIKRAIVHSLFAYPIVL